MRAFLLNGRDVKRSRFYFRESLGLPPFHENRFFYAPDLYPVFFYVMM